MKTTVKIVTLARIGLSLAACAASQSTDSSPLRVVNPGSKSMLVYL